MVSKGRKFACAGAVLIALACQAAYAQDQNIPPSNTENGVTYVTGGIGSDESQALRQAAKSYNLRLTLAAKVDSAYLADVKITISRAKGDVLVTQTAQGPYFYAQLKPGAYEVRADYQGKTQSRKVQIRDKGATDIGFYW
jgi:hypothetical protein